MEYKTTLHCYYPIFYYFPDARVVNIKSASYIPNCRENLIVYEQMNLYILSHALKRREFQTFQNKPSEKISGQVAQAGRKKISFKVAVLMKKLYISISYATRIQHIFILEIWLNI